MPLDNVFIERLWGTLKYEDVYLNEYGTLCDLREGLKECFTRYNTWRTDQALGKRTPGKAHLEDRKEKKDIRMESHEISE
jgi:putative transposase